MTALATLWRLATSRLGLIVIAAALGWWWGASSAREACEADRLREVIAAMQADVVAAREAERRAARQAEQLAAEAASNQERVDALTADLASLPEGDRCRASGDDVRRLRDIR
ncbi:hypothetical protein ACTZWW_04020 [Salinarimonas sp. NSM]|uniref:hypothetical protein n=1 Tax=Salinarimonas sp. NSM TaxID=3458003 RepID=UPI0040373F79